MRRHDCIFCDLGALDPVAENELAFAVRDKFPVKPFHTLIIPKRHVADIFAATREEREAIHAIALQCRRDIEKLDPSVAGFNFGSNIGEAAGQKVYHAHVHLIPRRLGDISPPPARP
jgi:diadenosine tetraphosphate (Ap4A) HIT family hydrolase